jgi:histidine ammonia-lyase
MKRSKRIEDLTPRVAAVTVVLTGSDLTIDEVVRVARHGEPVELAPSALDRMRASRTVVEEVVERGDEIYGFTTGVGMRKRFAVEGDMADFNRMMIRGHLIGQGPAAPEQVVRAMMTGLANGLAQGAAGARPELARLVVDALKDGVTPRVRLLGSVGQADLSANADLAEGLLGDFDLSAGEGLALLNNNTFSTGLAALAVADATTLLDSFDVAGALDLEAFAGNPGVLHPAVAEARPHPGLRATLMRLRELLTDSSLWDQPPRNLQDPLSFRTVAQVHGAARDALAYVNGVLAVELNAHQGNPLVIVEEKRILSVGNFDVVPLAAALDFLRIALAPVLTSAAERALKLLQAPFSGLPEGLGARPGLAEPALSELGAAVQAIAAEGRLLAQPVSFELASASQHEGIEDRTTMAPLAARRLAELVELGARVLAIELTIAAQAVDLRERPALGAGTRRAYELVRERVSFTDAGESLPADLDPLVTLVRSGGLRGR